MKICLVCGETYPEGRYQEHLVQRDHPYHAGDWDSQARNEQIIELLGEGFTYQEVADELRLTRARIGQIANRYGIYRKESVSRPTFVPHVRNPEMICGVCGGSYLRSDYHLHQGTQAHREEVRRRTRVRLGSEHLDRVERAINWYQEGVSVAEIERRLKPEWPTFHKEIVYRYLRRYGIKPDRPRGFQPVPSAVWRGPIGDWVEEMYRRGFGFLWIRTESGISSSAISDILWNREVPKRDGSPREISVLRARRARGKRKMEMCQRRAAGIPPRRRMCHNV